jgi:chaperone BCS1
MVTFSHFPPICFKVQKTKKQLGVASHEGRVLIMTTNHLEKLDEALIRPGRVDQQVGFKNATQEDAKEIFERMYTKDLPYITTKANDALNSVVEHGEEEKPSDELSQAAEKFAEQVPEGEFSPAELQGFLLKRKKDRKKAVEDIGAWVASMKERKTKGSKLLQVQ